MSLYVFSFWVLLVGSALAAFRWGERTERIVAVLFVTAASVSLVAAPSFALRYARVDFHLFVIDFALLVGLIAVAARSDRWWPTWAAALQMISVLAPWAEAFNPALRRLGYQLMEELVSFPMVLLLAYGVLLCRRRRRQAARSSSRQ